MTNWAVAKLYCGCGNVVNWLIPEMLAALFIILDTGAPENPGI